MSKSNFIKILTALFLSIIVVFSLSFAISADSNEKWTMKLGSKKVPGGYEYDTIEKFIELVEQKSDGRIKIDHYPNETLGSTTVELENLVTGVQEFYVDSYTHYAHFVPEFRVHSLSFLFNDFDEYKKFLLSPIQKEMEEKLINEANIRILNENKNWKKGAYRVLVTRKPVHGLEEINGLKLRLADAPATIKVWEILGASITIMPFSEVYLGLQQGMIDAVTTNLSSFYQRKLYEVVKEITLSYEMEQQVAIAMNEDMFQSLPQDLKDVLVEAANEAGNLATEIVWQKGEEMMAECKNEHGVNFRELDIEPVAKKAQEAHVALEESGFIPEGLIQRINEYLEK